MSYPHLNNDFEDYRSDRSVSGSPFDAPIELVQKELSWLLTDPGYRPLEVIMLEDYEDVDDLRAAILVNANKFSSQALNHILDEMDRVIDEYRKGSALL